MMNMPPFGSPLNDPKVREALRGVAETQAAQAGPGRDDRKRPTGSYFDDAKVVGALQRVGDGQAQSSAVFVAQNVLNGGEVSPHMRARHDQPRYQPGCERLLNMVPLPQGGITKRPGLESLGISPGAADASRGGGTTARFIPFIFSAGESRMLEMVGSDPAGSRMNLWMPDGTVREAVLELPYGSGSLGGLRYAQSADVVFLAHPGYPPAKISRHADDDWRYEVINWLPKHPAPAISLMHAEGNRGRVPAVSGSVDHARHSESLRQLLHADWCVQYLHGVRVPLLQEEGIGVRLYRQYSLE